MSGISAKLQALDSQVDNKVEWKYELRREAQEILPGKALYSRCPSALIEVERESLLF